MAAPEISRTGSDAARTLRALHRPGDPLVLPNAWDAASARAVEAAGFPAVATSSAAVAEVLGYADGESTPVDEMFEAVARIARSVSLPVTADVERGYGLSAAELVERLARAGASGCNLEDSDPRTGVLMDADEQATFLVEVRAAATAAGLDLVLNARIDVFLRDPGPTPERVEEAVRRAIRYRLAGADCVYPIRLREPEAIRALVERSGGPVNVLSVPGAPSLTELAGLGVARVSFGSGLYRVVQARTVRLVEVIRSGGDPYAEPAG